MTPAGIDIRVRTAADRIIILDIKGELTRSAKENLLSAYDASSRGASTIVLNLSELDSLDTLGIGLLLQLLARTRQSKQRLLAYGLNEECQRAFELTYLDEVVALYADEAEALAGY